MIIDLNEDLYIIDDRTHEHRVRFIDPVQKMVFADGTDNADGVATITIKIDSETIESEETKQYGVFYYGSHDLTVTVKK